MVTAIGEARLAPGFFASVMRRRSAADGTVAGPQIATSPRTRSPETRHRQATT